MKMARNWQATADRGKRSSLREHFPFWLLAVVTPHVSLVGLCRSFSSPGRLLLCEAKTGL
jgi:hypothetical protein